MPETPIEVTITETGFHKATHDWLVSVNAHGLQRIVATCPYPQYAEVVADALRAHLIAENVDQLDARAKSEGE